MAIINGKDVSKTVKEGFFAVIRVRLGQLIPYAVCLTEFCRYNGLLLHCP
jgi:hypothetical protein